ncbi:WD40 repeat-containing protein [Tieghemostelium lacteum]|uniref:WD40 repeat-containing protein n=1 Tax=Tieghemostelium lacteum TaxID=361077 RepID=A0A152A5B3_TIELA|nr:WD40 repeat-containing protein [Tieghemostelium lacteum]|eukprot:KYR01424.1 WD40 repeat-containing protein [Tieghemostelium lacteum]
MKDQNIQYISQKLNKIRYYSKSIIEHGNQLSLFATGSINSQQLSKNKISIWSYDCRLLDNNDSKILNSINHSGIVTDLKFFEYNNQPAILSGSSDGSLSFYLFNLQNNQIKLLKRWESLHNHCELNALDLNFDLNLATVGSDGNLNILNLDSILPYYTIKNVDGLNVRSVKYQSKNELVTSGCNSILKFWDIRVSNRSPPIKVIKPLSPNQQVNSLSVHPDQTHIIATGNSDGSVTLFDFRNSFAIDQNTLHSAPVWEISFNKLNSNQLYSCSEDGSIISYDYANKNRLIMSMFNMVDNYDNSTQLSSSSASTFDQSHKKIFQFIPSYSTPSSIDSFDISHTNNHLIACTSSQSLIVKTVE